MHFKDFIENSDNNKDQTDDKEVEEGKPDGDWFDTSVSGGGNSALEAAKLCHRPGVAVRQQIVNLKHYVI